jgi:hypothetical protein
MLSEPQHPASDDMPGIIPGIMLPESPTQPSPHPESIIAGGEMY